MSQHRSLRAASTLGGKRNVLKRFERTALLEKRGQRKAGDRITGLRKTNQRRKPCWFAFKNFWRMPAWPRAAREKN